MTSDVVLKAVQVTIMFMLLLMLSDTIADSLKQKYGSYKGGVARAVLLIGPTVVLATYSWKLAVAGWALWVGVSVVHNFLSKLRT